MKQPAQKIADGFKYHEYNEAYKHKEALSFQKHKHDEKKAKKLVFLENWHLHWTIIFILEIILQEMKIRRWPKDSLTSKTLFHIYLLEKIFGSDRNFPTIHFRSM